MKAYKGLNKDMTCRGFQFREGETYELPEGEVAKLCKSGFHACENPIDCFSYYAPGESVYHEVELDAATDEKSDNSKRVGRKIRIGAALSIANILKLTFEYVSTHCTNSESGGYGSALSGGDRSVMRGGTGSRFKGGMWTVFAVETRDDNGKVTGVKTAVVDGETIKAYTWYRLDGREFVECDE